MVPMRDGVKLAVDIYRPDTAEKLPALLAFAIHNKDLQGPDMAETRPAAAGLVDAVDRSGGGRRHALSRLARLRARDRQPARSRQVRGRRFARIRQLRPDRVDRGAALVRRQGRHDRDFRLRRRAVHGGEAASRRISRRSFRSIRAAPTAMLGGFRDEYPGGVIHLFRFLLQVYASAHQQKGQPKPLPPERETLWQEAMANPDYQDVPARLQRAGAEGAALAALFRGADQSVRQRGRDQEKRG